MPAVPLSRQTSWAAWCSARVCGASASLNVLRPTEVTSVNDRSTGGVRPLTIRHHQLAHMAERTNLNAIRMFIGGWSGGIFVSRRDWGLIAREGWASLSALEHVFVPSVSRVIDLRDTIGSILDRCAELGLGVILTGNMQALHGAPGGGALKWHPRGGAADVSDPEAELLRDDLAGFWVQVMQQWGRHPAVVGLDLLNEPDGPAEPYPDLDEYRRSRHGWPATVQHVVDRIREAEVRLWRAAPAGSTRFTSPMPLIIGSVGGLASTLSMFCQTSPRGSSLWVDDPAVWMAQDADTARVTGWDHRTQGANGWLVYSFHFYEPTALTHQGVLGSTWANLGRRYPAGVSRSILRVHDPATGQYSDRDWQQSCMALGEEWGNHARRFDNADDIRAEWSTPMALKARAEKTSGRPQPVYLGEFSFVQPVLEAVLPLDGARAQATYLDEPSLPVHGNAAWGEHDKYHPSWQRRLEHPPMRWITRIEVFQKNGLPWVRAYFDNLDRWKFGRLTIPSLGQEVLPPAPPSGAHDPAERSIDDSFFRVGFPVAFVETAKVPRDGTPPVRWPSALFRNNVRMSVTAGLPGTEAAAVPRSSAVTVELVLDQYWVEYPAPNRQVVDVPRQPLDPRTRQFPPVAIANFFSANTGSVMDTAREAWCLDVLCASQDSGMSWSYLGFDSGPGFIGWRPSKGTLTHLKQAASGRRLPRRI